MVRNSQDASTILLDHLARPPGCSLLPKTPNVLGSGTLQEPICGNETGVINTTRFHCPVNMCIDKSHSYP